MLAAAAGGAIALHLYRNYQSGQSGAARRAAMARRSPAQRLTDSATSAFRELVPASQMQGMGGHMAMPAPPQGFYGQNGMRQSGMGNPHAPVVIPDRRAASAPPPPEAAPSGGGGENGFENYGDDNVMGGQSF